MDSIRDGGNTLRRNLLLLFSLTLAPLAMHATPTIWATGSGEFFCGQAAPRPAFSDEMDFSFSGSNGEDTVSAFLSASHLAGVSNCTPPTLPSVFFDEYSWYRTGGGRIKYDGVLYEIGDYVDLPRLSGYAECSSPSDPNIGCTITFNSSGSGIDIVLRSWEDIVDSSGLIINETGFKTVEIVGETSITSAQVTEEEAYPGHDPNDLVPFVRGSFIVGTPEPAAWSLMTCAAPLLFLYIKRKKRGVT